jgi:hypothetical protein
VSSHEANNTFKLVITFFKFIFFEYFFIFGQFLILRALLKHFIDIKTKCNTYRKIKVFHVCGLITKPINIKHQHFRVILFNVNIGISFHMKTWTRNLLFFVTDFRVCFFYIRLPGSLRLRCDIIISIIDAQLSTRLFSWVLFFPDLGHAVMPFTYTLNTSDSFAQIFFAFRPFIKWLYFIYYFLSIYQVNEIVVVITLFCHLFWLTFAIRFRFQFQMEIIMYKTFF